MLFKNWKVPVAGSALAKLAVVAGLGVYGLANSFYTVDGGECAIVFNRIVGLKNEVYSEGTHLMIPWFERPIICDVRVRPLRVESTPMTRDLQKVEIGIRVFTSPIAERLPTIYKTLGEDYDMVLPSMIHDTLKAVVAQYNASQLIAQKEAVSQEIQKILTESAANFNIALDDVSITSFTFGEDFTGAFEAKQVAAQEAEQAKFNVDKAEQDMRSDIIRAEREAKRAQVMDELNANNPSQALEEIYADNPALLRLRKFELARELARIMSNSPELTQEDRLRLIREYGLVGVFKKE